MKSQLAAYSENPIRSIKQQKRADCTTDSVSLCEQCVNCAARREPLQTFEGFILFFFWDLDFWAYYTTVNRVFLCLASSQERQVCFH